MNDFPRSLSDFAERMDDSELLAHEALTKAALTVAEARRELGDEISPVTGKLDAMHVTLQTCAQAIRYSAAIRSVR